MRLYQRSKKVDLNDTIALCDYDADCGRVKLALERLHDLEEEVGEDARISYAEGLIRRDFLGEGRVAYECFSRALSLNKNHAWAACNASGLAPSEELFRELSNIAIRLSPKDKPRFEAELELLDKQGRYSDLMRSRSFESFNAKEYGLSASELEIFLEISEFNDASEPDVRRKRAQYLREMDKNAEMQREAYGENSPSEDRLALQAAIKELDRAIALDEYDAELWNLRCTWCVLLGCNEDAVDAADKSISLRPAGYPKPYHNRALALWHLGRDDEAMRMLSRSLDEARKIDSLKDQEMAESLIADIEIGRAEWSDDDMIILAKRMLAGANAVVARFTELSGASSLSVLTNGFSDRLRWVERGVSLDYVASVAQLLAYVPAEVAALVLRDIRLKELSAWRCCSEAMLYIAVHGEPVMRRDAHRAIALSIIDEPTPAAMRAVCRDRVLIPAAACPEVFGVLEVGVRRELLQMNNCFPESLMDQSPPTQHELERAEEGILARLTGVPFVNNSTTFIPKGCLVLFGIVIVLATIVIVCIFLR